ncbi:MAG: hypothetical protein GX557_00430 [Chloroflexi bacterium]|nr:hypothetical protein [Chloroflexota bacterium]
MRRRVGFTVALLLVLATSGGVWARETRPVATLSAGTLPAEVWRAEAETGFLIEEMTIVHDAGASACRYVTTQAPFGLGGAMRYKLEVPATGEYYLWTRVQGVGWQANSFWIEWDGRDPFHYEIPQFGQEWTWGWDAVRPADQALAPTLLGAGEHTLHVFARETEARLDVLVLTADAGYTPTEITLCGQTPTPTAAEYVRIPLVLK